LAPASPGGVSFGSMPPRKTRSPDLPVIGWREWVALPDLGVESIKAKIDTGARSSTIHAFDVEVLERRGKRYASFEVHPEQRSARGAVRAQMEIVDQRRVRSSTGHSQERLVVLMPIRLMGETWTSEVTLARRDQMGFRMLLGREALRGRFVIDPSRSFLAGRRIRKKKRGQGRSES
jgi:hypothetical protein